MRRGTLVVVAALAVLADGCSCGPDAEEGETALGTGESRIEYADGRVSLVLRDAMALAALEELSRRAGFALEVNGAEVRRLSLTLEDASLDEAIAALMERERYALEYAFDPAVSRHVIVALRVGDAPAAGALAPVASAPAPKPGAAPGRGRGDDALSEREERLRALRGDLARGGDRLYEARVREQVAEEGEALQQEFRQALDDPDPALRARAVEELDTQEPGAVDAVADLGQNDPDAAVRLAAAEALDLDGGYDAQTALRKMLETEQDPSVLAELISALGNDASHYPLIAPYLQHPNEGVREEAESADVPGE